MVTSLLSTPITTPKTGVPNGLGLEVFGMCNQASGYVEKKCEPTETWEASRSFWQQRVLAAASSQPAFGGLRSGISNLQR